MQHIMKLHILNFSICVLCFAIVPVGIKAQSDNEKDNIQVNNGPLNFPELEFTNIKGAPALSKPLLVSGDSRPVRSEGHGLAAPVFWDWDGDGLKDLLIGEFGSGVEDGMSVGNFIRVYKNSGTDSQPEFTGMFDYARPPFEIPANGTPYSVDQFCCIGFTPQFVDLNNDGQPDMITGQYYGEVSWFPGSKHGFMPGEALPQEGNPRSEERRKKAHQFYWLYSSASFGDFTGDGKPDLIVGGRALRMSKNIGTSTDPKFGPRELLLDVHGKPLKVYDYKKEDLKFFEDRKFLGYEPPIAGDEDLSPYVADWDSDGVSDLMVTNSYAHEDLATVSFFKGEKTNGEYRFHPGIPLFTAKKNGKAFPGSGPRISVTDWNSDGVNDLLIGASVITVHGEFNNRLSWNWEKDLGLLPAGKDPACLKDLPEETLKRFKETAKLPAGITIEDYMTIRHQGYVYVMLGSREETTPVKEKKTER
jgi:hypothetical protein